MAAGFADAFGASMPARAMGLLHDIGKASAAYQAYIRKPRDAGGTRGPDHSSAGAIEARKLYGDLGSNFANLLAFGIAGHHAGLADGAGHEASSLASRLHKAVEDYGGWEAHVSGLPKADELRRGMPAISPNRIGDGFHVSFLVRMLFSCLVDADFLATEAFYAQARGEHPPARGGILQQEQLNRVRAFLRKHRKSDTEVNRLRSAILDHANAKAGLPPGLFTLTVPTGGGKTLTSLSFALEHAMAHGLRRIVYVIPFTSIIEQTAQVFREDVGLGVDAVLEHHSSFDWDCKRPATEGDEEEEGREGLAKLRRDAENWDAPIVVTTAVQFFQSLFAARASQARKLHNLAKSVIVLDEVQSLPVKLLHPCMAAIDELARNYGATVILCTATQPALRLQDGALPDNPMGQACGLDIDDGRELAPDPRALYEKLRRVRVEWRPAPVGDAEIAAQFAEKPQMLTIVNSRAHARDLFSLLREQKQEGAVHLTTPMCARHRREVLEQVRADLKSGKPVRLVATSLIEAGVDVSFPEVWRAATGLSSIARGGVDRNAEVQMDPGDRVVAPSRGRGSKPRRPAALGPVRPVAPSRGRGSKRDHRAARRVRREVAPSQGRGSKLECTAAYVRRRQPAPCSFKVAMICASMNLLRFSSVRPIPWAGL